MAFRGLLAGSLLKRVVQATSLPSQAAACSSSNMLQALQQQHTSSLLPACFTLLRGFTASPAAAAAAEPALADDEDLPAIPIEQQEQQGHYRDIIVPIYDLDRQSVGSYTLGGDIFDVPVRRDILHRVVRWQMAKQQQGTHKTKGRSEVRGGGRKPRPQKGSGRSRQGTIRAPQWRGGGVVHGPVPRSHAHSLQKRVRRLGLQCALSAKVWERRLVLVDTLRPAEGKTKLVLGHVDALLAGAPRRSVLLCDSSLEGDDGGEVLRRGAANLPWVDCIPQHGLNVYSILQRDYLVITRAAVELLTERMRRPIKPFSPSP
ncbi:hypothetical protein D9Q98_006581 [Chlorella vulgaris]|uniref:Large ribosomal subunit protein uL4m n=1 Tax=Chlorella vulgaris TaxID=3077 RepID=A0A9D4YV78_CHLVU|nr:hypothetical protein D9Q98_006581 [Chlorella vulgaris]